MEWIKNINKTIEPYYALIGMMVFFIGLGITLYESIISPSDLRVEIQNESVYYPGSIDKSYEKIHNFIRSEDSLLVESFLMKKFLHRTTDIKKIIIKNTGENTLRNVKFRQINVTDLTALSISTDFMSEDEEKSLIDNLVYDENRQVVYFKNTLDIVPNANVKMTLWGNFRLNTLQGDVLVSHSKGDAYLEKTYYISGVKGFFLHYYFEVLLLMIIIFIAIYHLGIKYSKRNDTQEAS